MKQCASICSTILLVAVLTCTASAQRSSSATQTVTFGVHRSYEPVISTSQLLQVAAYASNGPQINAPLPAKITVTVLSTSSRNSTSLAEPQRSLEPSIPNTAVAGSQLHTSEIQSLLTSSHGQWPIVITITE